MINLLFFLIFTAAFPVYAFAEVLVFDNVSLKGKEIMIKAETKGRYFAKGGQKIELFIDGKSIGKVLSGGDGFAYKAFTPFRSGLYSVVVKDRKDKVSGCILSLEKGTQIVFIDIEGSLLSSPYSLEPVKKSREVIKNIIKRYPVVYLHTGFIGIKSVKEWLNKNKFPESAVLSWEVGSIFNEIIKKDMKIKAIIGSQAVIESAVEYKPLSFSFDDLDNTEKIRVWNEIRKKLK